MINEDAMPWINASDQYLEVPEVKNLTEEN